MSSSRKSCLRDITHILHKHGLGTCIGDYEIHLDVQYRLLSQTLQHNIEQILNSNELTLLVGAMWELLEETFSEISSIIPYEHIYDFAEYYYKHTDEFIRTKFAMLHADLVSLQYVLVIYRPEIWAFLLRRILETATKLKLYLTDPQTLNKKETLTKKIIKAFGKDSKEVYDRLSKIIHGSVYQKDLKNIRRILISKDQLKYLEFLKFPEKVIREHIEMFEIFIKALHIDKNSVVEVMKLLYNKYLSAGEVSSN